MITGLKIIHSQVEDGNLSYIHGEKNEVQNNRKDFLARHGLTLDDCVATRLSHSTDIVEVGIREQGRGMKNFDSGVVGDAMITTESIPLFLLTADCLPAVIYDPASRTLALAHLSTQNTKKEFLSKIIRQMQVDSQDLQVYFGPCIQHKSYPYDLVGNNLKELSRVGVPTENIEVRPVDTYTSPLYFSHRRSQDLGETEGRFATVAYIKASKLR